MRTYAISIKFGSEQDSPPTLHAFGWPIPSIKEQYAKAKSIAGQAILLFKVGDFYEMFYQDADTGARALGLTLTTRGRGEDQIPMSGFPYHQLYGYLKKLEAAGHDVAVAEQLGE